MIALLFIEHNRSPLSLCVLSLTCNVRKWEALGPSLTWKIFEKCLHQTNATDFRSTPRERRGAKPKHLHIWVIRFLLGGKHGASQ